MTGAECLSAAADLITAPGRWTQGAWARDANGNKVGARGFAATCFCAGEAIFRAAADDPDVVQRACRVLTLHLGQNIAEWNDTPGRTQAEVVAALRAAAKDIV